MELAEIVLDESGYTGHWQNDKTPEAPGRLENLKELVKALENFENLQGFLEHVSLVMDNDKQDAEQKVSIMTLHAAKGWNFPPCSCRAGRTASFRRSAAWTRAG